MWLRYYPLLLDTWNFNFWNEESKNIVSMCQNSENWMFYNNYWVMGSMLRAFQVFVYPILTTLQGGRCCYFIRYETLNQKDGELSVSSGRDQSPNSQALLPWKSFVDMMHQIQIKWLFLTFMMSSFSVLKKKRSLFVLNSLLNQPVTSSYCIVDSWSFS